MLAAFSDPIEKMRNSLIYTQTHMRERERAKETSRSKNIKEKHVK